MLFALLYIPKAFPLKSNLVFRLKWKFDETIYRRWTVSLPHVKYKHLVLKSVIISVLPQKRLHKRKSQNSYRMIYGLEWPATDAVTGVLLWCLFPELVSHNENKHRTNICPYRRFSKTKHTVFYSLRDIMNPHTMIKGIFSRMDSLFHSLSLRAVNDGQRDCWWHHKCIMRRDDCDAKKMLYSCKKMLYSWHSEAKDNFQQSVSPASVLFFENMTSEYNWQYLIRPVANMAVNKIDL